MEQLEHTSPQLPTGDKDSGRGDPPAWTNTEQPECPVLPAGPSLLSSATTGKKKLNGEASSLEKGEQLLLCLP